MTKIHCFLRNEVIECPCSSKREDCVKLESFRFDIKRELYNIEYYLKMEPSQAFGLFLLHELRQYFIDHNAYCRIIYSEPYEKKFSIYKTNEHYRNLGEFVLQFLDNEKPTDIGRVADIKFGTWEECNKIKQEILTEFREKGTKRY